MAALVDSNGAPSSPSALVQIEAIHEAQAEFERAFDDEYQKIDLTDRIEVVLEVADHRHKRERGQHGEVDETVAADQDGDLEQQNDERGRQDEQRDQLDLPDVCLV